MKTLLPLVGAIATAAFTVGPAFGAVIGTYTFDYSTGGNGDGQGFTQGPTGVQIVDDGRTFEDTFVFDDLAGATIDSFTLSFDVTGASESFVTGGLLGLDLLLLERWTASADGLTLGILDDDTTAGTTFTLSDDTTQAFTDAIDSLRLGFSFSADGLGLDNSFTLSTVTLSVNGSAAVVPLPAPGFLLLAALGGLTLLRRKGAPEAGA